MNDENNVIKNYDEKNSENEANPLLVAVFAILLIVTTLFTGGVLFFVYLVLWIIFKKNEKPNNELIKAYNTACKVVGIIILVCIIAMGACFFVVMGGEILGG